MHLYQAPRIYDAIMGSLASGDWLDYYLSHTRDGSRVLELACGTGKLAIPLAEAGRRVTGLDLSPEMLALARTKGSERSVDVTWTLGDMTDFDAPEPFETVIVATQSLSHLHERTQLERFFRCVRRALAPGGTLLLELFSPSVSILAGLGHELNAGENVSFEGASYALTSSVAYDAATQCADCEFTLTANDMEHRRLTFRMRQFFPQELDALVAYNGFTIVHKYGDLTMRPFTSRSNKQLLVCRA
jgi:ubiquinone/menaquinone biosynthesis C-methylase UbiE